MRRRFALILLAALLGGAAPALCADNHAPAPTPRPAAPAPAFPPPPAAIKPAAPQDSTAPADFAARLDAAKQSLDQIESFLGNESLSDDELAHQYAAIDPIQKQIQLVIADVTPKQAAIKARVDQLGPAPDLKANPPPAPEDAAVAQDRADQMKLLAASDDFLKRANLLELRSDQLAAQIASRRRALFAGAVFRQEASILAPGLWIDLANETPRVLSASWAAIKDYSRHVASGLSDGAALPFLSLLVLWAVAVAGAVLVARRVIPRKDLQRAPNDLQKAAAALWTLFTVSVIPVAGVSALYALFGRFGLYEPQLQPLDSAVFWGVIRCAAALGLGYALLAPQRGAWRPIDLSDEVAQRLMSLVLTVVVIISGGKIVEALNEVVGANLRATVAVRGAYALLVVFALVRSVYRTFVTPAGPEIQAAARPKQSKDESAWLPPMRFAFWLAAVVIVAADLLGFIALSAFIVEQFAWTTFVGGLLFLLLKLSSEGTEQAFRPASRFSRFLIANLGARRESLQQFGVLLSAAAYVALCAMAALLVLAPWGVHSHDMLEAIKSAFFGVKVGEVTISLSSVIMALLFFAIGYGLTHAVQNWLENRYLPLTQLDTGLRASIRTSVGYVGVIASLAFAFAYLGLNMEKLALVAGALSVGIGLGLQSVVNNFVSGLILLWERAIRVGDWVMIGADQGYVRRISVRSTEIETFDRATMIVPNGSMVTGVVKNFVRDDRVGRIVIPVSVIWGTDPEKVREVLFDAAKSQDEVVGIPAPSVLFSGFNSSSLDFELVCFVENVERALRVKSDLHFAIFSRFAEAGLRMTPDAPPQPTLTLDVAQIEPLLQRYFNLPKDMKP